MTSTPTPKPTMTWTDRIRTKAFAPMDIAGLVAFRVMFGALMLVDFARYWRAGWIDSQYVDPAFLFKYMGFGWVEPLPRVGMYAVFALMMVASTMVMLGFLYRLGAWLLFVGHTYLFLLSATHYLNHAYLLSVIALLMAVVPVDRGLSLDVQRAPARRRGWTPAWAPWLLRIQLGIVYVYGGIAKINPDWLAGEPIRGWLRGRAGSAVPWIADLLRSEVVIGLVTQGGLWFDLLAAPALLWRKTRWLAVLVSAGFHLTNAYLFNIGVFPWFMLAATTLYFEPDWPRRLPVIGPRLDAWLGPVPDRSERRPKPTLEDEAEQTPQEGAQTALASSSPQAPETREPPTRPRLVLGLLAGWFLVQLLVPLRHHLYPGNVAWTEEGHHFSWRMKLRTKSGAGRFVVFDPAGRRSWVVDPQDELSARQTRKMLGKPELVRQYAHHLAERWKQEHGLDVEVRAQIQVSLNRRRRHQLVDPTVDLSAEPASLAPASWIMPGPTEPVPRPRAPDR
ncbi:MAG: HTTM domain-containing protein [Myxococcota bacterium]